MTWGIFDLVSTLRFDGLGAGLGKRSTSGDRNDPVNYVLLCSCELELGPLARFLPNKDGYRTALCPRCDHVTIVRGTQIERVVAASDIPAVAASREKSGLIVPGSA